MAVLPRYGNLAAPTAQPIGGEARRMVSGMEEPYRAMGELGNTIFTIAQQEKEKNDQAAVEEAYNEIILRQQELTFGENGFTSIRGGDAYRTDIVKDYGQKIEDAYSDIINKKKLTAEQQNMLRPRYLLAQRSMNLDMIKHQLAETADWRKATAENTLQVEASGMMDNLYNPIAFRQHLPRYMGILERQADAAGLDSPELIKSHKDKAASHLAKLSVERAISDGNLDFAKSIIAGDERSPLSGFDIDQETKTDLINKYRAAWDKRETEYEKQVEEDQELESARLLDGIIEGQIGLDHLRYARETRKIDGDQFRMLANARMNGYDDPMVSYDLTYAAHTGQLNPSTLRAAVDLGKITANTARSLLSIATNEDEKKITSDPDYKFVVDGINSFTVKSKGMMESFEPTTQTRRIDAIEELNHRVKNGERPMDVWDSMKPRLLSGMDRETQLLEPRFAVRSQSGQIDRDRSIKTVTDKFIRGEISEDEAKREINRLEELAMMERELEESRRRTSQRTSQ